MTTFLPPPAHTAGNISLAVLSVRKALIVSVETITSPYASLEQSCRWSGTVLDPVECGVSRRRFLSQATAEKSLVLAYHFSFPGLGHVAPAGSV